MTPPPPTPSSRFPDAPPQPAPGTGGAAGDATGRDGAAPAAPTHGAKSVPLPPEAPATETTTRLRPIPPHPGTGPHTPPPPRRAPGRVDLTPDPATAGRPFVASPPPPPQYDDRTTRLRPLGHLTHRIAPRAAAAAACLVLGVGLLGGATTGFLLTGEDDSPAVSAQTAYHDAAALWHSVPVDRLFPRTLKGEGAGPGGSDRTWTRIAVAPDSGCAKALDPLLHKALRSAGCLRLLRATYVDATQSSVTTVGLLFTKADAEATQALRTRFTEQGLDRRDDLMPRPYAAEGTAAARFGDAQRASWTINVLTDAPVVVYAVSGFADGRTVADPQPAAEAMKQGATTAPAQAGLGHEAQGVADRIERGLRKAVQKSTEQPS
ncbi:hypothetical protein ACFW9D_27775 [Streptomyces sp. NPDC059524]|uniref:hypothetical protein n=1 Tax=Streptomyces sp. NPDC059524 TaxID=3346856 RepID=UPI0036CED20B